MSALQKLMGEIGWMIHDLMDGEQIDNAEEERLIKLHKDAAAELEKLQQIKAAALRWREAFDEKEKALEWFIELAKSLAK